MHVEMDYRGIAALVIAVALGTTLVLGVAGLAISGHAIGEAGSQALTAIGGALVGALAAYMSGSPKPPSEEPPAPPPSTAITSGGNP